MNERIKLSPRLNKLAQIAINACFDKDEYAPVIADVGCDHGKLTGYLAQSSAFVHAIDISSSSLDKTKKLCKKLGISKKVEYHCSDGLVDVRHTMFDGIILAGIGEINIMEIIESSLDCAKKCRILILLPMDGAYRTRKYLQKHSFEIIDEELVKEDNRIYTIIAARYGKAQNLSEAQLLIGPKLIENKHELLGDFLEKQLKKHTTVLTGLMSATIKQEDRIDEVSKLLEILVEGSVE